MIKIFDKEKNIMNLSHQQIIDKYKGDWYCISMCERLPESFMRDFQDKINWDYISTYQILSEKFIREYQDKVDWCIISQHQTLSESFIREYQDKVDWFYISKYQKLSDSLIREFQDKVEWYHISRYQKHINYDHLVQSLPKPKKGSLISFKNKGYGIILNIEDDKYEILSIKSQQINTIIGKYDILNLKVIS